MSLEAAIDARSPYIDAEHQSAFRLFNHFSEGAPAMTLDIYQRCLLLHDYTPEGDAPLRESTIATVREKLPWLTSGVTKIRNGTPAERKGTVSFGQHADLPDRVFERGAWYALDLLATRDASFYLDARELRAWLKATLKGKRVLNTFAYTGSLSVAARVGGAQQVITTDQNPLDQAKRSLGLNALQVTPRDFPVGDFFKVVTQLKRVKALFDCVILDPPFFATEHNRRVDVQNDMGSLINKVRPLVGHEGWLVLVNNAVFHSGADYMKLLDSLCADGFLTMDRRIDVPSDCRGFDRVTPPPSDPAPFNHSTKIAILRVTRKDGRRAT